MGEPLSPLPLPLTQACQRVERGAYGWSWEVKAVEGECSPAGLLHASSCAMVFIMASSLQPGLHSSESHPRGWGHCFSCASSLLRKPPSVPPLGSTGYPRQSVLRKTQLFPLLFKLGSIVICCYPFQSCQKNSTGEAPREYTKGKGWRVPVHPIPDFLPDTWAIRTGEETSLWGPSCPVGKVHPRLWEGFAFEVSQLLPTGPHFTDGIFGVLGQSQASERLPCGG